MNLTICLVAYSKKFTETVSYKRLTDMKVSIKKSLNIIIFDNGQVDFSSEKIPNDFSSILYYYNPDNTERGTRIAYQYALMETKDEWFMLLDDDTMITEEYIGKVIKELTHPTIDAICPQIFDQEIQISPTSSETIKNLKHPKNSGIYNEDITGISSGLVLSRHFMLKIGGFTKEFPLDYLDHWIFWQLRKHHQVIKVMDEKICHQLSVQRLEELSKSRFVKIFTAEYYYYKSYQPEHLYSIRKKYVRMIVKGWLKRDTFPGKALTKIILGKK
ncbi:glycosyl transferase group 2 family protein [Lactococcus cremoris]|uniref:Glycosyl transferase group 2 family protein n=1 Tax=Lactococcus lactis subsp. cremoris TaxID=1359 RepID=A0A166J9H9_LACLC|nr:glycosyltransferase [Lactococcus cremoris]KZK05790.1 glycosyl transferase group 2 family protein [Lactococcus cremoris]